MATHISPWRAQTVEAPPNSAPVSEMRKRYPNDYKFTYDDAWPATSASSSKRPRNLAV